MSLWSGTIAIGYTTRFQIATISDMLCVPCWNVNELDHGSAFQFLHVLLDLDQVLFFKKRIGGIFCIASWFCDVMLESFWFIRVCNVILFEFNKYVVYGKFQILFQFCPKIETFRSKYYDLHKVWSMRLLQYNVHLNH